MQLSKNFYRLMFFLPLLIGTPLGLFLTQYPISERLMLGAALGGMSHFIYKMITVVIISKTKALEKMNSIVPPKAAEALKDVPKKPVDSLEAGA